MWVTAFQHLPSHAFSFLHQNLIKNKISGKNRKVYNMINTQLTISLPTKRHLMCQREREGHHPGAL